MENLKRYYLIDSVRGFSVLSMVVFHALWNMVYIFNVTIPLYKSVLGSIWQKSICIVFIFLSGFCFMLGRKQLRRALILIICSFVITIFTMVFMPENIIHFGILGLIGSSLLITLILKKLLCRINGYLGIVFSLILFILTFSINNGYLGISHVFEIKLWSGLYTNMFTAYLGFPSDTFVSYDYFPVLPWIFMYLSGYYTFIIFDKRNLLKLLCKPRIKFLEFAGRHALITYLIHQPVIYAVQYLIFQI